MAETFQVLIMGASYGSLLASKLLLAGHTVKLVCLHSEAELINREGIRVRLPIRGQHKVIEIDSRELSGDLSADAPEAIRPVNYDLVALAMQEPQLCVASIRRLLDAVALARVPCMSVMNMPPLPYLKRIPGLDAEPLRRCYTDPTVWDRFEPEAVTMCSPDPQAFRPLEEKPNVLQVTLPTNFKAARFESDRDTEMLRRLQADIESIRYDTDDGNIELPVKLKVHDSIFVPLAKWCMLMAGNYRCVRPQSAQSIRDAVHGDRVVSQSVYEWVGELCRVLGATEEDQVPFEKYAHAAEGLEKPSSAARALFSGATEIERVDWLVQGIVAQKGMRSPFVDQTVALVDGKLQSNRRVV